MRQFLYFLLFSFLFFVCRKAALVTDNTLPRVEASISLFDKVLKSSEEGWLVETTAKNGLRHIFWMEFNPDGRVTMISDRNEQSLKERESSYSLRQRQQPTLSFDTYNYISELADPDLSRGRGRGIDFEYAFSIELSNSLQVLKKDIDGGGGRFNVNNAV